MCWAQKGFSDPLKPYTPPAAVRPAWPDRGLTGQVDSGLEPMFLDSLLPVSKVLLRPVSYHKCFLPDQGHHSCLSG